MTHSKSLESSTRSFLAQQCVKGISIGDAFGESFFGPYDSIVEHIKQRTIPESQWEFTDDTVMAIAVLEQLEKNGEIDQSDLALQFAIKHNLDPNRGYGATVRTILRGISEGKDWHLLSKMMLRKAASTHQFGVGDVLI